MGAGPAAAPVSVRVDGLRKSYRTEAGTVEVLRGIALELTGGESLAVTGPSGSGKSTLLHVLGTLERPSGGSVSIAGADPFALPDVPLARFRNRTIGFVFQDHHLLPQYTLEENVLLPALAFPEDLAAARERATALIERVGLAHRAGHRPAELSGGERQRAAVARALLNRPGLVLCDEPTGNLDTATGTQVLKLIDELHAEGLTVVVITHDHEVSQRAERIVEIRDGVVHDGVVT
jgi:ABC-type lipoprotein export system ATPase subunit